MKTAIIGYTGFVGSNIAKQIKGDHYNSKNIQDIRGRQYDMIICAGAPGAKYAANQEPKKDLDNIRSLIDHLNETQTAKMVLISTTDVFIAGTKASEDTRPNAKEPYGLHRYWLEQAMTKRFDTHTLRLPALFGPGLRKNFLFDMMTKRYSKFANHHSKYQFYPINKISRHIQYVLNNDIPLLHLATEPLKAQEISRRVFCINFKNESVPAVRYNMQSNYYERFLYSAEFILREMSK